MVFEGLLGSGEDPSVGHRKGPRKCLVSGVVDRPTGVTTRSPPRTGSEGRGGSGVATRQGREWPTSACTGRSTGGSGAACDASSGGTTTGPTGPSTRARGRRAGGSAATATTARAGSALWSATTTPRPSASPASIPGRGAPSRPSPSGTTPLTSSFRSCPPWTPRRPRFLGRPAPLRLKRARDRSPRPLGLGRLRVGPAFSGPRPVPLA